MKKRTKSKFVKKKQNLLNWQIKADKVRVIGNGEPELMDLKIAIENAKEESCDVILISDKQEIPIVKIEDYNKFLYKKDKLEKERKKSQVKVVMKEIKLSTVISDHDLETKARKAKEFLEAKNKVKCTIQMKGRQKASPERGEIIMLRFAQLLEEVGVPENMPKLEGSKWNMIIKPKK